MKRRRHFRSAILSIFIFLCGIGLSSCDDFISWTLTATSNPVAVNTGSVPGATGYEIEIIADEGVPIFMEHYGQLLVRANLASQSGATTLKTSLSNGAETTATLDTVGDTIELVEPCNGQFDEAGLFSSTNVGIDKCSQGFELEVVSGAGVTGNVEVEVTLQGSSLRGSGVYGGNGSIDITVTEIP